MKKKILSVALVVALLAIVVSSSLAYFTAQDAVTNTFTVGSVKIEIFENDKATDKDVIEFTDPLIPVVNTTNPADDENYIDKAVDVKNTGVNDAYIRTHIGVPTALVDYLVLDIEGAGWTAHTTTSTATVEGVEYTVFTYDYDTAVSANDLTTKLLKGVYLASDVDLLEDAAGNLVFVKKSNGAVTDNSGFVAHTVDADGLYTSATVSVLVASQAIQADGFTGGATAALDSGFTSNPWA